MIGRLFGGVVGGVIGRRMEMGSKVVEKRGMGEERGWMMMMNFRDKFWLDEMDDVVIVNEILVMDE